jgi:DNA-binding transcriptional MerR regulator
MGKIFISHAAAVQKRGVCTRTLDRWAEAGIIPPPQRINGRKYHDAAQIESAGGVAAEQKRAD